MTLIPRSVVVLAVLLASTTATPPPGYAKQPSNDDKNPASYRYKYEVEDKTLGDGHGKSESREGEHAHGRYYVNAARASTDVKYVADEWGYHPFVKYAAQDDHSSASASFAFGEKPLDDSLGEKSGESGSVEQPVKLLQPYANGDNETFDGVSRSSIESGESREKPLKVNYITGHPQLIEPVSTNSNELFYPNGHQSPTIASLQHQDNNLSPEDENSRLVVENVGSFGQRTHSSGSSSSSSSSSSEEVFSTTPQPSPSTRISRLFHGRTRPKNSKPYLPDIIPGLGAYSSSAFPPVQDNSVGGGSSFEIDPSAEVPATTANPLLINYGTTHTVLSSKTAQELIATIQKSEQHGFAKPIVVQELHSKSHDHRPFEYSTTFECQDDEPITANPLPASDSASSHILNPIQAGLSLVVSGDAHLIGNPPPAPVNEHVEDTPPQDNNIIGNTVQPGGDYVGVNPAFGGVHDEAAKTSTTPKPPTQRQDQLVEVQKSIEIYSSSPASGHELQLTEQQPPTIDQQKYLTSLAELGNKHGSSRTRSELFTKIYELGDGYAKNPDKPVYVIPPGTYMMKDGVMVMDKKSQPHQDVGPGELKKQRVPYRTFEKKKLVAHSFPLPVVPLPIPVEKVIERKVPMPIHIPIPHPYPVEKPVPIPVPIEKIVEKPVHIPIPVEKIIEKKIPISQPFPIEVTKYIEKPVIVHAPYGVQYHGVSYQQIMKPQNHGLYSNLALASSIPPFPSHGHLGKNEPIGNSLNHSQIFQGYVYDKPSIPFHEGKDSPEYKKLPFHSYVPPSYSPLGSNSIFHRRHAQPQRDDYFGPVPPPLQHLQRQFGFQSKQSYISYPERPQLQTGSRKSRNHEPLQRFQKGNFRQSKIEYGFKPPMVPSVQYDEDTASKVES